MTTQEIISKVVRSNPVTDNVFTRLRLFWDMLYHYRQFRRNFGRLGMKKSESKFSSDLRIRVHAIEKGLSLPNPHVGFGEEKVKSILRQVESFQKNFSNMEFLTEIKSILDKYFEFNSQCGHTNQELYFKYNLLFNTILNDGIIGGIKTETKENIINASSIDFKRFAESRFSVRDFSDSPVDTNLIRRALKMAEKTPSACNRQPWRVYIYKGDKKLEILKWQGGSKGFWNGIDAAILVCCNTESYFMGETNLPYVDGGLYAMTLMYALHSLGLGTIPLTTGLMPSQLKKLYSKFDVKDCEVPILLIGIGSLKEKFNVAASYRYNFDQYTSFIE